MQYVMGNDTQRAGLIMNCLDIDASRTGYLGEHIPKKGEIPVLISGGGYFHGDTLILSNMLKEKNIGVDVKVIFDGHTDFWEMGCSGILLSNKEKYEITEKDLNENPCLMKSASNFASHSLKVYLEDYLEAIYILGVEKGSKRKVDFACEMHRGKWNIPETKIICSPYVKKIEGIKGKRIHISADIDLIPNLTCLANDRFMSETGPSLKGVSDAILKLIDHNELVAFDIVGWHFFKSRAKASSNKEGLKVYSALLEQLKEN